MSFGIHGVQVLNLALLQEFKLVSFFMVFAFLSYFFVKKKYLLDGVSGMLWTGGSVRDVCISHQSYWIYY